MTNAEKKCRELWKQCVKYRDRWCVVCGWATIEAHHIYFQSQGNWKVQYDIDFGVSLCPAGHRYKEFAPHVNNGKFLDKILPRIRQVDTERAAKVIAFLNEPQKTCAEKPCFAEIAAKLQLQLTELKELYWMNYDCEPYARTA